MNCTFIKNLADFMGSEFCAPFFFFDIYSNWPSQTDLVGNSNLLFSWKKK